MTSVQHAFFNGRIRTMHTTAGEPALLIVENGRVKELGDLPLLQAYPDARLHDLRGRTVLPGFIDAHNHLSVAALHPRWADLSAATTIAALGAALTEHAASEPEVEWVRGAEWSEFTSQFPLTRAELDTLPIDRPIAVANFGLHHGVVSSRALEALGIGRTTPDPEGGEIVRGADGQPTGVLIERAWSEAHARSVATYLDPDRWASLVEARGRFLLQHGITCVHDAACTPSAELMYRALARDGRLPLSVLAMPHPERWFDNAATERLDGPPTGDGDERFRIGPMKFFADGGTHCAIDAHVGGQRVTVGHRFPHLADGVARAVQRGFEVAVHAMGNVGVESTLAAFGNALRMRDGLRLRLEHATLATPEQIRRLGELGVVGVVQPGFVAAFSRAQALGLLPQLDEAEWLPFRALATEGIRLAASSDDPCAPVPPLDTATFGMTRTVGSGMPLGPKQGLPYDDWLRAYTIGAAYAGGQEHERGQLAPGHRADLIIVEGMLGPDGGARVVETWIEGAPVYQREDLPPVPGD
jgi:predicted amidohydrolase YtcJ